MLLAFLGWYWEGSGGAVVVPPAAPVVGAGSAKKPKRRHFVIGDKHVIVDDRTELEAVVAMLAQSEPAIEPARVVRKREPVPATEIASVDVAPVEFVPMRIDWAALDVLLRQSIRLEQPEVIAVIRDLMRRYDEDEDDVEALLLA